MKVITISNKKLKELEPLKLEKEIFNTEARMYNFSYKGENKILKSLYDVRGMTFANKLYTLEALDANRDYLPSNFCIPDYLCVAGGNAIGFTLPKIDGINLSLLLNSKDVNYKEQLYYLKKIGEILLQLDKIRRYTPLKDIYINDLHSSNFIVDNNNRELKVIDLDSCKIMNNKAFASRFLTPLSLNMDCNKYKKNEENSSGYIVADKNSDLYCYNMMLINYLYGSNINSKELSYYYEYLNYLNSIGINKELLDCFYKILSESPNKNPISYIDSLTSEQVYRAKKVVFEKIKAL